MTGPRIPPHPHIYLKSVREGRERITGERRGRRCACGWMLVCAVCWLRVRVRVYVNKKMKRKAKRGGGERLSVEKEVTRGRMS